MDEMVVVVVVLLGLVGVMAFVLLNKPAAAVALPSSASLDQLLAQINSPGPPALPKAPSLKASTSSSPELKTDKVQPANAVSTRIRSVSHYDYCLAAQPNGHVKLARCEEASWFRYNKDYDSFELEASPGQCLEHTGNASPLAIRKCPVDRTNKAAMFKFVQHQHGRAGFIKMSDDALNQCFDLPGGAADQELQTFWCASSGNQNFLADYPRGDLRSDDGKPFWDT